MAATLKITNSEVFASGFDWPPGANTEFLGNYGDNGGDPDGNAWLPMDTVSNSIEARWLIENGYAKMVEVKYAKDQAIANTFGMMLEDGWSDDDNLIAAMKAHVDENSYGWAHYGAYGTDDSLWVFEPLGEVHP